MFMLELVSLLMLVVLPSPMELSNLPLPVLAELVTSLVLDSR